ncbi:MAG TPA: MBL fold metallo-hydrolase [Dictyoglomaceae bacterium]|nr:MBL fold metallo-hydrolase [Dictyoglomaceae bacterium]
MKSFIFLFIILISLVSFTFALEIKYFGHSCFRITFENGFSLIIDPYSSAYPMPKTTADLMISSHEHDDHYNPKFVEGKVEILVGTKNGGKDWNLFNKTYKGIKIWNIPTYHDDAKGSKRGKDSITVIEGDGIKIVHLGDIGTLLSEKELEQMGKVDILIIPVGGFYTLNQADAVELIKEIKPKIAIPMHYKTEYTKDWPISPLDDFLKLIKDFKVKTYNTSTLKISKDDLPKETEIWVLNYK